MTRMLSSNNILPNKSQSFSIVWADDTDTICSLSCFLTYLDNFASNRHKDATRSPATGRSARRTSNGAAAPSSLPSSSPLPQPPFFANNDPSTAPAPTAGIFAGIHSHPWVTSSTCSQGQVLSLSLTICSTQIVFLTHSSRHRSAFACASV